MTLRLRYRLSKLRALCWVLLQLMARAGRAQALGHKLR